MSKVAESNFITKSSRHYFLDEINYGKNEALSSFINEYARVSQLMINFIWDSGFEWELKTKDGITHKKYICPRYGYYDCPKYFDYNIFNVKTDLSKRALSSMTSQVCGMVKAAIKKHQKRTFVLQKLQSEYDSSNEKNVNLYRRIIKLKSKIDKNPPLKPHINTDNFKIELSSKCATLHNFNDKVFNHFLKIQSIGNEFGKILIPVKEHRHSRKLLSKPKSTRLGSFLVSKQFIEMRYKIEKPKLKSKGKIVGGDTGKTTILTMSDSQTTKECKHGHSLSSIIDKLSRRKKGSKGFKKAQAHRINFINHAIKQLNFSDIKELKLEKVTNIFFKKSRSRKMSHWNNADIEKAIISACVEAGVQLTFNDSTYRSQRCSDCGFVRKSNRSGKTYKCNICFLEIDADFNSSKNQVEKLSELPVNLRRLKLNRKGFFWTKDGLFDLESGSELRVPDVEKETA